MKHYNIAVVGADTIMGIEVLKILEEREFPVAELRLYSVENSSAQSMSFKEKEMAILALENDSFRNIDFAFFFCAANVSKKYAPPAVQSGAVVIDISSAFCLDNHVPLVVPEVNPQEVFKHQGIISGPSSSSVQLVIALKPICDLAGIARIITSTYQSVSGSGKDAILELKTQIENILRNEKVVRKVFPHQIAFNLLPQIDEFDGNAFTSEEMRLIHETKKIFNDDHLKITATSVYVPVNIGHAQSVYLETKEYLEIKKLKKIFMTSPGIRLVDDIDNSKYPMPIMSEVYDEVMVGRLRRDPAVKNGINLWVVANNLRKGAALNAVQIAELLVK